MFLPYSSYCTREWQIYQYSWSPGASTLSQCNRQLLARPLFLELFRQSNLRWKLWGCCSERRKSHLSTFQRWGWFFVFVFVLFFPCLFCTRGEVGAVVVLNFNTPILWTCFQVLHFALRRLGDTSTLYFKAPSLDASTCFKASEVLYGYFGLLFPS